jgi:cytochrome c oxidase subunit 2
VRRGTVFRLVAVGLAAGAAALAVALFVPWLPEPASREAGRIWFVFWFTAAICIAIFAVVASVIIYSVVKFRVRPDDDSDGPPIHGHTGLEIVWTATPAVLVTAISIVSAVVLAMNEDASAGRMRVEVTAQQFAWSFKYLDEDGLTSTVLRVPVGRQVELLLTSRDVIHSFWVPDFAQKLDAVPGQVNRLFITPTRLGTYPVMCTELCGLGHPTMRSEAIVMTRAAFERWVSRQRQAMGGTAEERGRQVFTNNGCDGCHVLRAAGSTGTTGPNLDRLPTLARRAGKPLDEFIRESVTNPDAYIERGYPNAMPPFDLPDRQLDALVQYLVEATRRGS